MEKFIRNNCQLPVQSNLFPKVVLTNNLKQFTWSSIPGYIALGSLENAKLTYVKIDGSSILGNTTHWLNNPEIPFTAKEDGSIVFEIAFPTEGEYSLEFSTQDTVAATAQIFVLEEDLYDTVPLKGDFHTHTSLSDGKESPEFVVMQSLKRGMDFVAITDHHVFCPPQMALELQNQSQNSILVLSGEEIHLPVSQQDDNNSTFPWFQTPWVKGKTPVHLIHCGGNNSINELADNNLAKYYDEVTQISEKLPGSINDLDKWNIASSYWAFEKIKAAGGLAIFPHPYWMVKNRTAISDTVREYLFNCPNLDGVETVNAFFGVESVLNTCDYHQHNLAPVSGSDCHNFGDEEKILPLTIVFAKERSTKSVIKAVEEKNCCTVTKLKGESTPIVTGNLRLLRYTLFLVKNYLPKHDEYCRLLGLYHPINSMQVNSNLISDIKFAFQQYNNLFFGK